MMFRSMLPSDLFAELDRFQRDIEQALDFGPSIRGMGRGGFPALNMGATPRSIEVYAFVPGLEPSRTQAALRCMPTCPACRKSGSSSGWKPTA